MKKYLIITLFLSAVMIFSPLVVMVINNESENGMSDEYESETVYTNTTVNSEKIRVLRTQSNKVIDIDIYDYVVGAVAAEMPASYSLEALKAQAVAGYSYALWIMENADNANRELYDISDNSDTHQAYSDYDQLKEKWGEKYDKNIKTIKDAVNSVLGEYLCYENEPAMCVYHAISGGSTQSAKQAWGNEIAYLKSVTAPGDTLSPDFDNEISYTQEEIKNKLNISSKEKIEIRLTFGEGEYVKAVSVSSKNYSGTEFASALGLTSPCFTVNEDKNGFNFTVKGKGHGIGMSQYSADYMARQGSTYKEILAHFYPGTTLLNSN